MSMVRPVQTASRSQVIKSWWSGCTVLTSTAINNMGHLKVKWRRSGFQLVEHVEVQTRRGPKLKERAAQPDDHSRSSSPMKKHAMPTRDDGYDYSDQFQDPDGHDDCPHKKSKSSGKASSLPRFISL